MNVRNIFISTVVALTIVGCANDPASKISSKLGHSFGADAKSIKVTVNGSQATLTGTVAERATQELSEEVALSVSGITSVDNQLSGPSRGPIEKLRTEAVDASLEASVKSALGRSAGTDAAHSLEVEACDGVVSLRGKLASRESAKGAIQAAEGVEGVRKVIDLIEAGGR